MAIEKRRLKVSRLDLEMSSRSRESMSSDEDVFTKDVETDEDDDEDDDDDDDCDSGAGSDDFDLLELGKIGEEFVQIGDRTCSIPIELYDLPGFSDILCMDVWNDVLTEEERFGLAKYLPDMGHEIFMQTLKELFTGCNMHFGNPVEKLFKLFKGGLCEPRVALYRQGLNFFQNCKHYHLLRKYQNSMVNNLHQIKDAWTNCRGYSIEEKLRVLNVMESQKSLMHENMEELETDSAREDSVNVMRNRRLMNQKVGQKISHYPEQKLSSTFNYSYQERQIALDRANYGRQNPRGTLKVTTSQKSTTKELAGRFSAARQGMEMKLGPNGFASTTLRHYKASKNDSRVAVRMRDQVPDYYNDAKALYEAAVQSNRSFSGSSRMDKPVNFKISEKYGVNGGEQYSDIFTGIPLSLKKDFPACSRNRTVNQLTDIELLTAQPSKSIFPYECVKNLESPDNMQQNNVWDRVKYEKGRTLNLLLNGSRTELSDRNDSFWHGKAQGEPFSTEPLSNYGNSNVKSKSKKFGKCSPDNRVNNGSGSEYREDPTHERKWMISNQDGQRVVSDVKRGRTFTTDSDSSEQYEDDNPLMRSKWAFPSGASGMKSVSFPNQGNFVKRDKKSDGCGDELSNSKKMGFLGKHSHISEGNSHMKAKQKNEMDDIGKKNPGPGRVTGDNYEDDWGERSKFGRNGRLQGEQSERISMTSLQPFSSGRMEKIETMRSYSVVDDEDGSHKSIIAKHNKAFGKNHNKSEDIGTWESHCERSNMQLLECTSLMKKRKVKDDMMTNMTEPDGTATSEKGASDLSLTVVPAGDVDLESKSVKKQFTLITPSVDSKFSFSIIHLLSAVRMAMITVLSDDSLDMGKHHGDSDGVLKHDDQDRKQEGTGGVQFHQNMDKKISEQSRKLNIPSLTVQDIVNRVKLNPGDPCILLTQEPLQDLVRGVLKLLTSKTPPLGAKGWKAVVQYEKSTKAWSWIGPQCPSDQEAIEEVTSPEAWGLPRKVLVKLVDSFANWLKSSQKTLRLIGSLPAPPLTLMQLNIDEKERFKDSRAQKSLNTISPSSDEVRSYFRKEEVLRYSIPDRAFSYIAADGRKSSVAPLRRCGGKLTSKARDHFLLKQVRPPHVTVLCLVRDAAARLPGSIGTRADVCTLIRDSQYVVEDFSDVQVNQVVSGALDRLHYERDPCVQFDGERKLWVYLHREREEEDFEDDGTSSTKKWKRPKKEASEREIVNVAYNGTTEGDQTRDQLSSTLIVDPLYMDDDKRVDQLYYNDRHMEVNSEGLDQTGIHLSSDLIVDPSRMVDDKRVEHLHSNDGHMEVNIKGLDQIGIHSSSDLNVDPSCMDNDRSVDYLRYNNRHMEVNIEGPDQTGIHLGHDFNVDTSCMGNDRMVDHLHNNDQLEVNIEGLKSQQRGMHQDPSVVWQAHGLNFIQENSLLCVESSAVEDFDNGNLADETSLPLGTRLS